MDKDMMEWKQAEDREISLKDLFWKIVYSWRLIIVYAVIFAVAICLLRYVQDRKNVNVSASQPLSQEDMKETLSEKELAAFEQAVTLEKQIAEKKSYKENNLAMNLDAYEKDMVTLQYYVDTDYEVDFGGVISPDYTEPLANAYVSYVNKNGMAEELAESLGENVNAVDLDGLIYAEAKGANTVNMLNVYVSGEDAAQAEKLARVVKTLLAERRLTLASTLGAHELTLVNSFSSVVNDEELALNQENLDKSISTLQTQLDTLTASFTSTQKALLAGEIPESTVAGEVAPAKPSVKYLILGAFVGIFLACVWLALRYIMNNKVRGTEELEQMFGVRILGKLVVGEKKKRFFGFVDRWLDKLCKKAELPFGVQKELILTNLKVGCKKANVQKLFLTASLSLTDREKELVKEIRETLEKEGITVVFEEVFLCNARALEQLAELEQVVLIEKAAMSEYAVVEKELNLCAQQKVNVLGVIGIE